MPARRPLVLWLLASVTLLATIIVLEPSRAGAAPTELLFSEYVEGSSNNKALEIHNGTGAPVDLATGAYNVQMFFNANPVAGLTINLTGTVASGDVFVLAHSSATASILAVADQTNGAGWFNGDDAVVLRKGTTAIDSIGQVGFDPGSQWGTGLASTADNTLRRKPTLEAGDANAADAFDPSLEWDGFATDTFDGLGCAGSSACTTPPPSEFGACGDGTETPIHAIQGSGLASPLVGQPRVIEGIVVGDFQGSGAFGGFYVQEEDADADGDSQTSEGLFVLSSSAVAVGDAVRVRGTVTEFNGLTELAPVTNLSICSSGNALPTMTALSMPVSAVTDFEASEGMLVTFPQPLVVSEYFNYDRFGEMVLGLPLDGETRPFTPTAIEEPGAPALARAQANNQRRITLDDGLNTGNPSVLRHPNGDPFALDNRFRGGDTVQNVTGVMDFRFGLYRIQPTAPADYTAVNTRPESPDPVGGDVQVASMNTLNFFLTLDYPSGNPLDNTCGSGQDVECRGADADQPDELTRQRDKLLAALVGLEADVIGLNEIENTPGVDPLGDPTSGVVPGLNSMLGPGTYAAIDTGTIGVDAIRVGLIYKPSVVEPVGDFEVLDSSDDPRFRDTLNRPALAQTFDVIATGARFTVVVNHLKSKGSDCNAIGDPDVGDGQGNCNQTRTLAAQALVDWLATDPTGSGDPDFLITGDLNSYAREDPIDAVKAGPDDTSTTSDDYTNLVETYGGTYAYSYVFDGQAGYLDHALSSANLTSQVTGATEWHINADEPDVLDYDTTFKPPSIDALYEPNAYRSSDHDAVLVGLSLCENVDPTLRVSVSPDLLWPPNHRYVTVQATVTVSDNEDPDPELELVSVASNEPDNGPGDGNTTNDIVIVDDDTFRLRAERNESGSGRIYTITYQATDDCGNSTVRSATVSVPVER
jgi:uncharacterized protein